MTSLGPDQIQLTVRVDNAPGLGPFDVPVRVSTELVFNEALDGTVIHYALDQAAAEVADVILKRARQERDEQRELERLIGGPVTPLRMAMHIAKLASTRRPDLEWDPDDESPQYVREDNDRG
jgi:hypothetical protein